MDIFRNIYGVAMLCLIAPLLVSVDAQGRQQNFRQCFVQTGNEPNYFHAPARFVPPPRVDSNLRREFLLMFHREGNPSHNHSNPHDTITEASSQPPPINASVIAQINAFCPRDAFFYSFSPRHLNATMLLQQQFIAQRTAADLLRVAKQLLHQHIVNPRVWYYALLGATIARPDLNGYYLAWAIDATPDLYVPFSVLQRAIAGSARPFPEPVVEECRTAIDVISRDVRFPIPQQRITPQQQQQQQQQQQGQRQPTARLRQRQQSFSDRQIREFFNRFKRSPEMNDDDDDGANFDNESNEFDTRSKRQAFGRGQCVLFNGTQGATSAAENRLWYFREDMQLTQHHWYWHQYFPQSSMRHPDRRGEQFYFSHHQIIARFNAERLSNGLQREEALDLRLGGNIGEGYNADLVDSQSGRFWTPRTVNTPLSDIDHQNDSDFQLGITMNDISNLYQSIISHVGNGFLLANRSLQAGQPPTVFRLEIRNPQGFGDLANTVEAAEELSANAQFYHSFGVHNLGHVAIALATDPDFRCQRPTGILADLTVTFRDPAFYKIHTLVDDLFDHYKSTLPPYQINSGEWPLLWEGVRIQSVEIVQPHHNPPSRNLVQTFWTVRNFPLEEGIDGSIHEGDVETQVCQQHLNHEPFTFRVVADVTSCNNRGAMRGTMRLFMAPRYDVDGRRFEMTETRRLMYQLDSFPVDLRPGRNVITRNSQDSSLTKPFTRTLQDMLRDPDNGGQTEYCGCGWPQHLYISKGTPQGMEFDLFAMLTNFAEDQVVDTPEDLRINEPCNSPFIICGIPYRRYPDARPMGYPFDRLLYSINNRGSPRSLEEYVGNVPNMGSSVVIIRHLDAVLK